MPSLNLNTMPQYNEPDLITELVADDIVLIWQDIASANKTITFANLVASVNALISKVDAVNIVASNTTLDSTYQFVVANSGGTFNITLPSSASNPGLRFRIGNKGSGTVTVQRSGFDNIAFAGSSSTSTTIAQYETFDFESDGAGYWFQK